MDFGNYTLFLIKNAYVGSIVHNIKFEFKSKGKKYLQCNLHNQHLEKSQVKALVPFDNLKHLA